MENRGMLVCVSDWLVSVLQRQLLGLARRLDRGAALFGTSRAVPGGAGGCSGSSAFRGRPSRPGCCLHRDQLAVHRSGSPGADRFSMPWRDAPAWPQWRHAPLFDYTLPMFLTGRAGPFLDRRVGEERSASMQPNWMLQGTAPQERDRLLAAKRQEWKVSNPGTKDAGVKRPCLGQSHRYLRSLVLHVFSRRPLNRPNGIRSTWARFIFPRSRLSLLPLASGVRWLVGLGADDRWSGHSGQRDRSARLQARLLRMRPRSALGT